MVALTIKTNIPWLLLSLLVLVLCAGTVSCFIMERFAPGVNFMLSADLDHAAKNYKFGFGFSAGE